MPAPGFSQRAVLSSATSGLARGPVGVAPASAARPVPAALRAAVRGAQPVAEARHGVHYLPDWQMAAAASSALVTETRSRPRVRQKVRASVGQHVPGAADLELVQAC